MRGMFMWATSFSSDLSSWHVSASTDTSQMLQGTHGAIPPVAKVALTVLAEHWDLRFSTAGALLLVAGVAAPIAVAKKWRRGTRVSAEPLLADA